MTLSITIKVGHSALWHSAQRHSELRTLNITTFCTMPLSIYYYKYSGILDNDIQHYDIQHYGIQHYGIQHYGIQHYDIQHYDIQLYDIHHNDIQRNDIQHKSIQQKWHTMLWHSVMPLNLMTQYSDGWSCWVSHLLSVKILYCYAKWHCAECRYAKCRGALL